MPGTFRLIFGVIRCAGDKALLIFESHDGPDVVSTTTHLPTPTVETSVKDGCQQRIKINVTAHLSTKWRILNKQGWCPFRDNSPSDSHINLIYGLP